MRVIHHTSSATLYIKFIHTRNNKYLDGLELDSNESRKSISLDGKETMLTFRSKRVSGRYINPLKPNSDLSQTSHCNIKYLSVSAVMRMENMINQVKFY